MKSSLCVLSCVLAIAAGPALAGEKDHPSSRAAGRLWQLIDLIQEKHLNPPTREELCMAAAKGLLGSDPAPADLSQRVSKIDNAAAFANLLKELVGQDSNPVRPDRIGILSHETRMADAVIKAAGGTLQKLPPRDVKVREQLRQNRYVGIGVQIAGRRDLFAQIVTPFPGGPAHRAGIKANDFILAVDGRSVKGEKLEKVIELLRGEEGTSVTLIVQQADGPERTCTMKRGVVPIPTTAGYARRSEESWRYRIDPEEPIGYVRITNLNASTVHDLRLLERELKADGIRALVLDFRFMNVQGGVSSELAAALADALLDSGLMWRTKDKTGVSEFHADADCLFRGWPLAVLVNSPVNPLPTMIAASLQDNGRAVLVGGTAMADPVISSTFPAPDGRSIVLIPSMRWEPTQARETRKGKVVPGVPEPVDGELLEKTLKALYGEALKKASPDRLELLRKHFRERARRKILGQLEETGSEVLLVQPNHELKLDRQEMQDLFRYFHDQEAFRPTERPADPQLAKAFELMKQEVK